MTDTTDRKSVKFTLLGSCWAQALNGISPPYWNDQDKVEPPEDALKRIYQSWSGMKTAFWVFGEGHNHREPHRGYGKRLAAYIVEQDLGTIDASREAQNPLHVKGHMNTGYFWAVDWKALEKWARTRGISTGGGGESNV